ncbi:MAG: hypothetical protein AB1Z19_02825 [Eubacteriales bacterium]
MAETGKKTKQIKHWALKIFFISLLLAAVVSVVAEYFTQGLSVFAAFFILILIVVLGVLADVVGVAFATCDQQPFIAMSAKRIPNAKAALNLLKKADIVSNFCNDVIGDICGIVSGAAGAAIALKVVTQAAAEGQSLIESGVAIGLSSLIAASTVAGKAIGKTIAMKRNREIVSMIGSLVVFFKGKEKV